MLSYPEDTLPDGMEVIKKSIKYCRKMGYVVDGKLMIDKFNYALEYFQEASHQVSLD